MKYIIDVPDEAIELMGGHISIFVEPVFKTGDCKRYALRISKGDIEPYTEPDRKVIEDEVWKMARLISLEADDGGLNPTDLYECYKSRSIQEVMKNHSYQEAKAQYEVWKRTKEIRVGDEVEYECDGIVRFVVTGFCGETAFGFKHQCDYDDVGEYCDIEDLRKTGRHFPEVAELLKKMRKLDD